MKGETRVSSSADRDAAAKQLSDSVHRVGALRIFAGLDGFVDEIIHVVDQRVSADVYTRMPTMTEFAERIQGAAGKSTNIELVNQRVKLGGNGPILANSLASFGCKVTYLGALGFPHIHRVFEGLSQRAAVHSIADHGYTQALEFDDAKLMLVKSTPLNDVNWSNIEGRFGREPFMRHFAESELVTFVNWTMVPFMTQLWEKCIDEICPTMSTPRRLMFFDLADPEKRPVADLVKAIGLMRQFEKWFHVTLGLNEKEAVAVADAFGITRTGETQQSLIEMARALHAKLGLSYLVVHPIPYAFVVHAQGVDLAYGPVIGKALITTGAGDHFNAGFCLGKLLGLEPLQSITLGVASSGYYVKNAASPSLLDLISFLEAYPAQDVEND